MNKQPVRNLDSLYVKELNKVSPSEFFNAQELNNLIETYQQTEDIRIRDVLFNSFIKYIILIANKHTNNGLELRDLISEGTLGFFHAIKTFDTKRDVKFVTYAYTVIGRWMREAIEYEENIARLPKNIRDFKRKAKVFLKKNHLESLESVTALEELPKYLQKFVNSPWLFSHVTIDGFGTDIQYTNIPEEFFNTKQEDADDLVRMQELKRDVAEVMDEVLTEDEHKIISLFFGIGYDFAIESYIGIAEMLNLSQTKVHRLKNSALTKLREQGSLRLSKYLQ